MFVEELFFRRPWPLKWSQDFQFSFWESGLVELEKAWLTDKKFRILYQTFATIWRNFIQRIGPRSKIKNILTFWQFLIIYKFSPWENSIGTKRWLFLINQTGSTLLTLTRPLRRKLRIRWFSTFPWWRSRVFLNQTSLTPLRFLMRIFWEMPIKPFQLLFFSGF